MISFAVTKPCHTKCQSVDYCANFYSSVAMSVHLHFYKNAVTTAAMRKPYAQCNTCKKMETVSRICPAVAGCQLICMGCAKSCCTAVIFEAYMGPRCHSSDYLSLDSFRVQVRLQTSLPFVLSESTQKNPCRSNWNLQGANFMKRYAEPCRPLFPVNTLCHAAVARVGPVRQCSNITNGHMVCVRGLNNQDTCRQLLLWPDVCWPCSL